MHPAALNSFEEGGRAKAVDEVENEVDSKEVDAEEVEYGSEAPAADAREDEESCPGRSEEEAASG